MYSIICLSASFYLEQVMLMVSSKGMAFSRGKGNVFLGCREGMKEKEGKKALCRQCVCVRP